MTYYKPTRAFIEYMRTIRGKGYKIPQTVVAVGINWIAPKRFKPINPLVS